MFKTKKKIKRKLHLFFLFSLQLTIEYVFNVTGDYWTLIGADIDWEKSGSSNTTLYLNGDPPAAPVTFSYKCSRPLIFGTNNYYLELANIQVCFGFALLSHAIHYDDERIVSRIFTYHIECYEGTLMKHTIIFTYSWICIYLIFFSIYFQVQVDVGVKRFNDSYDCIGFTSAPIWSGVFVSFIICFVVAVGLNQIMEIKPPNRFENSRGKQLTFTISE